MAKWENLMQVPLFLKIKTVNLTDCRISRSAKNNERLDKYYCRAKIERISNKNLPFRFDVYSKRNILLLNLTQKSFFLLFQPHFDTLQMTPQHKHKFTSTLSLKSNVALSPRKFRHSRRQWRGFNRKGGLPFLQRNWCPREVHHWRIEVEHGQPIWRSPNPR